MKPESRSQAHAPRAKPRGHDPEGLFRRALLLGVLACAGHAMPNDLVRGFGVSPGAPGNPNDGQPPCHHGSAQDPDAAGDSDPVDLFRGELILDRRDLFLPGRGLAVDVTFHYRSKSVENGQYGYGWTFNYSRRIRKLDDGNAVLLQGTNYLQEYAALGGGAYEGPDGIYSTLHENQDGTFTLTYRHGAAEEYDVNGCLVEVRDPSGNALSLEYDPAGPLPVVAPSKYLVNVTKAVVAREYRLTRITDTIGNEYDFFHDADGRLERIEYSGRTIRYGYTPEGDLGSVTLPATQQFPAGRTTTYAYVDHNLTEVRNAEGEQTLLTAYDQAEDRVLSQTFEGGTATYSLSTTGGTTKATVVDRKGFASEYTFNAAGQVVRSERFADGLPAGEPSSYVTSYEYAPTGELVRVEHPRGNAVELTRGLLGLVTEVRRKPIGVTAWTPSPDDLVETYTYEPVYHQVKTATDPLGRSVTFTYDYELSEPSRGLLRRVELPAPPSGPVPEIEYAYDADGLLAAVEDPNGNVTMLERDPATGYVERFTRGWGTAAAVMIELDHDAFGNVTAIRNGLGQQTTLEYDAHDMVTRVVSPAPSSLETRYRYDANDKVVQVDREITGGFLPYPGTSGPFDGWQTTRFTYDDFCRVTSVIDDRKKKTSFTYDPNGNLATLVDALGRTTTYTYDERDLPLTMVDARTPAGTTEYRHDPNGNLASIRSPEGHLTSYLHDDFDRLERMTYADGSFEEYGYDDASNLTSLLTANGQTITYGYDEQDRLTSITRPGGADVFDYDPGSRLLLATNAEAEIELLYDAADRVTHQITTFAGSSASHAVERRFDAADRLDRITYPDASQVTLGYDSLGRLRTVTGAALLAEYGYNGLGNPTSIERANGVDTTQAFDSLSRLTALDHAGPLGSLDARTFGYDVLHRRKSEVGPEGTHAFAYDELSQLVETTRPAGYPFPSTTFTLDLDGNRTAAGGTSYVPNALDQYASVGGTSHQHDLSGNLTDDGTLAYGYDAENRLTSASGVGLTATYGYDPFGRRVRKTVGGATTLWVYDGDQILQELDATETVQATFVYGLGLDEPLTMTRGSQTSWYLADPIGSVTALTDATGAIAESYRYDAFGASAIYDASGSLLATSALENPFLFTGRELDPETGLYHYRARAYSPTLGRFLQRDPLGQLPDVNVYRYVGNHPLDATDPFGLDKNGPVWIWLAGHLTPEGNYPRWFGNGAAGLGDGAGAGLLALPNLGIAGFNRAFGTSASPLSMSSWRRALGAKSVVNECSGAYIIGEAIGTAADAAIGGVGLYRAGRSLAGKLASRLAARGGLRLGSKAHRPPGWNKNWEWRPGSRKASGKRWWDDKGGEWRWHGPDKYHPDGHWDYNPWKSWNSPWQNVPAGGGG